MNSVPKNCTKLKTVTDNSASSSSISQPSVSSSVAGETRMCKYVMIGIDYRATRTPDEALDLIKAASWLNLMHV